MTKMLKSVGPVIATLKISIWVIFFFLLLDEFLGRFNNSFSHSEGNKKIC